jgi:multicomponent Na+:H+ antiporter subunit G
MITTFLDIASWGCLMAGGFFGLSGAVGMLRFPDFYTRLHAAGVTDTLCVFLILIGLMLQAEPGLVTLKLFFILLFITFTSPTSSHALARAAYRAGPAPLVETPAENVEEPTSKR